MSTTDGASRSGFYEWTFSGESESHGYIIPGLLKVLEPMRPKRVLDLGCGNGAITGRLAQAGYDASGLDFTESGIELAQANYPQIEFHIHDIGQPLPEPLRGKFDAVISAEVIEHLFLPREIFARAREALSSGGHVVVTTPYHGYLKNLAVAAVGGFDRHWSSNADYGHIKFFSRQTLTELMDECGFTPRSFIRVGRIPPLAASMVMAGELKPATTPLN